MHRLAAAVALPCALVLAGCDTEEALLKQRLEVLKAEEAALQSLKATLAAGDTKPLEGPGKVSLFLSDDVINGVLKGADGVSVPLPEVKDASITVNSIRTDFKLGYPLLKIDATAKKGDFALSVVGVARLIPAVLAPEAGKPAQLELKIHVDSLVPRAQWGIFDFRIQGFVRELAHVTINDKLRAAGVIRFPVETNIPLNVPAKQTTVSFTGATVAVSTPDLSLNGKATITNVIALPDGLHVYGQVNVAAGV